ncbi:NAD(P)-dependent oxidoreductase [Gymnodinialimonas hymeniacidonis]|uniref:NAD(P)-dependent oxidoreductase n=1 Tax=Gymnodinialimonas hymeniacidonis TaxID=3126508 RepID=UPI0034C69667
MSNAKPILVMDQHFRQVEELFRPSTFDALQETCDVVGAKNWPMPRDAFLEALPEADYVVAAQPQMDRAELDQAPNLKAVIEVSGTFQMGLDYEACFERGIEVLSCSPGFQFSVAEMALGLMLAGARGIVEEHERFRNGSERWLDDRIGSDFTLFQQTIGFVGYGAIAREITRLLAPFSPNIVAYDPWLAASGQTIPGVRFAELDEVVQTCRTVVVAAMPTEENYHLISAKHIASMQEGALLLIVSRAHLVDFDAAVAAAEAGKIRVASDVFPTEPVPKRAAFRTSDNVIWSPHRAAAVEGGRHPIGDMIVDDIAAIQDGRPERRLLPASPDTVRKIIRAPLAAS